MFQWALILSILLNATLAFATDPATQPATRPAIPAEATKWGGHYYLYVHCDKHFSGSKAEAEARGGILAGATSKEETAFLGKLSKGQAFFVPARLDPESKKWVNIYTGKPYKIIFEYPQMEKGHPGLPCVFWAPSGCHIVGDNVTYGYIIKW